ncbi:MAG: hypothetical protein FIA97_15405 [Methylococcaceae bacterium]|nr:hypothetical protein [Methylococcaceae bacterium]
MDRSGFGEGKRWKGCSDSHSSGLEGAQSLTPGTDELPRSGINPQRQSARESPIDPAKLGQGQEKNGCIDLP